MQQLVDHPYRSFYEQISGPVSVVHARQKFAIIRRMEPSLIEPRDGMSAGSSETDASENQASAFSVER